MHSNTYTCTPVPHHCRFLPFLHTLSNKPQENSWINMFCFPYVTSHFQNALGSLGPASQLYSALVSSLNWDSLYISLTFADLILGCTLPSADIYCVTSITLGNTRHTAVPKLGCWKLSALQFFPSWKYTPGSRQDRVRRFKPCSWETTEMSSYKCVQALPICSSKKNLGSAFGSQMKRSIHCRWIKPKHVRQRSVHLL